MTYLKVPIVYAMVPKTGFVYVSHFWWVPVKDHIIMFTRAKNDSTSLERLLGGFDMSDELSPQCNWDMAVVARIHPNNKPEMHTIYMESVYLYLRSKVNDPKVNLVEELVYVKTS